MPDMVQLIPKAMCLFLRERIRVAVLQSFPVLPYERAAPGVRGKGGHFKKALLEALFKEASNLSMQSGWDDGELCG